MEDDELMSDLAPEWRYLQRTIISVLALIVCALMGIIWADLNSSISGIKSEIERIKEFHEVLATQASDEKIQVTVLNGRIDRLVEKLNDRSNSSNPSLDIPKH